MSTNRDTLTITNTLKPILIVPYDTKLILDIIHKFNLNNAFAEERMRRRHCSIILLLRCGDV